jgi:hypothetical protein
MTSLPGTAIMVVVEPGDPALRGGEAPELYAVTRADEIEPIALSNRRQAWTVGARWALANRWDGRF